MRNTTTRAVTSLCFALFAAEVLFVIAQMWGHLCSFELFSKLSITNGALLVLLITLNFMIKEDRHTNKLSLGCFALFGSGVSLSLIQMWLGFFNDLLFIKLMLTNGAVFIILFIANFLIKENRQTDAINDGEKLKD